MLYYAGIALISAATILLELALLRLFAVQQFYHFAFMAISLALLGAGASGSILSVWPRRLPLAVLCLAFGLATIGAYLTINYLPFDSFSIAWDRRQLIFLAIYFLAAATPFLFSGLLVGGELMRVADANGGRGGATGSHQVYGANLIGSALGSLASLLFLGLLGGVGVVILTAALGAAAALLFSTWAMREAANLARERWLAVLSAALLVLGLVALLKPADVMSQQLSPYKTLSVLSQALDARHILTDWNAVARLDVVDSSTIHSMPGLSLLSPATVPRQAGLMLDGDNLMPITALAPQEEQAQLLADYLPNGLAFHLRPNGRTLVLEAGGGADVLFALAAGAEQVTVAEDNALIIEVIRDEFGEFTGGLYSNPRVTLVNQSGRVFARQASLFNRAESQPYDLVIVALTDPHRPVTSGAYSLTEDYNHTVEAFDDYLQTLGDGGLLVVTRWLQTPPSESGRTFGAIAQALANNGLNPADRLIAFRSLRTMTILASQRPFSAEEIEITRSFLRQRNFDPVYFNGLRADELNRFNRLQDPLYHELFVEILDDPGSLYSDYRFDIRPPTDDRPFFFHYFKWRQTPEILATLGYTWQPFGGSGYFVLVALLLLVVLASAVLILGPLVLRRSGQGRKTVIGIRNWRLRVFVYFAGLGLAFLFVEVPLAQRFIQVLDQPVTALAIVLFAILLFSGLGSLTVRRWQLSRGLGALILLIILYPLLLRPLTDLALALSEWERIALTILALAPLGYLMGLPFAGGLAVVERVDAALVPWAWAINGSLSVISSVLAVMVAVSWGFSAVLWLGAAAYGAALLSFWRIGEGNTLVEDND